MRNEKEYQKKEQPEELFPDDEQPEEETELYEHHRFIADQGQSHLRIDKFLVNRIENASRNKI